MPEAYTGEGELLFTEWQVVMCPWLRSNKIDEGRWFNVMSNNLKGAAIKWMNLMDLQVARGQRQGFATWQEWVAEARQKFEPTTLEEVARAQLRRLKQSGTVRSYVKQFQNIIFRIPDLIEGEAYSVFTSGLKQPIRTQVVGMVRTNLDDAIALAKRLDSVSQLTSDQVPARKPWHPRRAAPQGQVNMVQGDRKKGKREKVANKKDKKPLKCWTCGKIGHPSFLCPTKKKGN